MVTTVGVYDYIRSYYISCFLALRYAAHNDKGPTNRILVVTWYVPSKKAWHAITAIKSFQANSSMKTYTHRNFLGPLSRKGAGNVICEYILIMKSNISITMCNSLLCTDIKSTKIYGNGKSGLDRKKIQIVRTYWC